MYKLEFPTLTGLVGGWVFGVDVTLVGSVGNIFRKHHSFLYVRGKGGRGEGGRGSVGNILVWYK